MAYVCVSNRFTRRFAIRCNGTKSKNLPEGTATKVAEEIYHWLAEGTTKPTTAKNILGRCGPRFLINTVPEFVMPAFGFRFHDAELVLVDRDLCGKIDNQFLLGCIHHAIAICCQQHVFQVSHSIG